MILLLSKHNAAFLKGYADLIGWFSTSYDNAITVLFPNGIGSDSAFSLFSIPRLLLWIKKSFIEGEGTKKPDSLFYKNAFILISKPL